MSSEAGAVKAQEGDNRGLAPKLRFPEFAEHPLYDIRLGDVTRECKARNKGKFAADLVMGVSREDGIVPMQARLVADDISRYKILRKDWFAYNPMRLNIGSIGRWQGGSEVLVSPDYVVFRCEERDEGPALRADYLDHFRRSTHWSAFTGEAGDGGVRVRIYYDDIAKVHLILPGGAEQRKIADCLSSLDELIAAETDKLEALRDHKKALMQQLFPRPERVENGIKLPAEATPRLRFPQFRKAGEWVDKSIGSSSTSFSGGTPSTSDSSLYGGDIPFIRSAEIDAERTELSLTVEGLSKSSAKMVASGDVLIAMYGANSGNAAISKIAGAINQAILCLRHETNNQFLFQFWVSRQEAVKLQYLQGGQGNLSGDIIKSIRIPTPGEDEQREIANCLGALDDRITAQFARVEDLKAHKSGLMQQLFPSSAEAGK